MGLEFHTPKTLCEKFPVGCQFCDLLLCDGKKESATIKITRRDFHSCVHGCEESVCLREHEKYGSCNMYSEVKQTNADRIRAMSDEELAEFIDVFWNIDCDAKKCLMHDRNCQLCILDWLRQEAET